jgi:hypothetical protein
MQNYRLLELAIKGLEAERAKIDFELSELRKRASGSIAVPSPATSPGKASPKRRMSAAARKKISEAMKRSHAARRTAAKK